MVIHSEKDSVNGKIPDFVRKITPTDECITHKLTQYRADITHAAISSLRNHLPEKIIHFNTLVNVRTHLGNLLHTNDLNRAVFPVTPSLHKPSDEGSKTDTGSRKRTKVNEDSDTHSSTAPVSIVPHKQIRDELEKIKKEASELIEMVSIVKLWIQLNVPRIEDGNNFGVGIQEEAIQELARVEDNAFNLYDTFVKYYMARAKLSTKVLKYPTVIDYQEAVRELDEKEWLHIKITKVDMRNNYSMLYDLLNKNWEKVVKPKNEDTSNRMVF